MIYKSEKVGKDVILNSEGREISVKCVKTLFDGGVPISGEEISIEGELCLNAEQIKLCLQYLIDT